MSERVRLGLCIAAMTATITVMFGFGRNVFVVMWPEITERLSINYSHVSVLVAFNQGAYLLMSIVAGRVAVVVSPPALIGGAIVGAGVLLMTFAALPWFWTLLAIYTVLGGLIALAWTPMVRFASSHMRKGDRVSALSVAACGTALGFIIDGTLALPVVRTFGFAALWLGCGAATVLVGVSTFLVLRDFRERAPAPRALGAAPAGASATAAAPPDFPARTFLVVLFMCGLGLVSFQSYFAAYLVEDLGIGEKVSGQYWMASGVFGVFSGLLLSRIANRASVKTTIVGCLAVLAGAIGAMTAIGHAAVAFLVAVIYGLVYFGLFGLFPAFLSNTLESHTASRLFGKANLCVGLGSVSGGILGGNVLRYLGSFDVLWLSSTAAVVVATVLMWRMPKDETERAAAPRARRAG